MSCPDPTTWEELVEGLLHLFKDGKEAVDVEEVTHWFNRSIIVLCVIDQLSSGTSSSQRM